MTHQNQPALHPLPAPPSDVTTGEWRSDGEYLYNSAGVQIGVLFGDATIRSANARRLTACIRAMRGITTENIEVAMDSGANSLVGELVNNHLKNQQTIAHLQDELAMHRREIEQQRELLRNLHAYELQREVLSRSPGAQLYGALCKRLGIGGKNACPPKDTGAQDPAPPAAG
ncbi:hypothetical protein [Noviherbaspirillum pedocola]|uniref:Uncharacterized protein n=1 Tax=Noviherbaspirillum pedocola TaxID=2801341 RepID=A0A934W7C7_9BURK|nr:hypothetical protein [Noviherbaspirillum pedocola]MBK4736210.1 hypothetical protein [Noviherbaspirillum pedocola]